jgi:hypothetical protein
MSFDNNAVAMTSPSPFRASLGREEGHEKYGWAVGEFRRHYRKSRREIITVAPGSNIDAPVPLTA